MYIAIGTCTASMYQLRLTYPNAIMSRNIHLMFHHCMYILFQSGLGQAQIFSACSKAQALIKVLQAVSTFQALIYNVLKYFLKHFQSASSTN